MDASVKQLKATILGLQTRIAEESAKTEAATQGKREEVHRKLQQAKEDVTSAESYKSDICQQKRQKQGELDGYTAVGNDAVAKLNKLKDDIQQAEHRLEGFLQQEKDNLAPYGNNIKAVLAEIGKKKWYGEVLGPLGMYVRVKDQKWAPILRMQLGNHMYSFNVTDGRDLPQLKELFRRTGKYVSGFL